MAKSEKKKVTEEKTSPVPKKVEKQPEETMLDLDSIPEFEATKSENQDEELDDIED